jgi:Flp pilus assembly protein CpaB
MLSRLASLLPAGPGRRWRRVLRRRRRPVTAALAAVCLLTGLHAVAPPRPPSAAVLVAARDLAGGARLTSADLTLARLPPPAVPSGALTEDAALGRTLAAPMRQGEPVTDVRLVGPRLADALSQDLVETPIRLADPAVAALLHAGDRVDVLAAPADPGNGGATTVAAADVQVLAVPAPADDAAGLTQGALVVLATTRRTAMALAAAAAGDRLSVTLLRGTSRPNS